MLQVFLLPLLHGAIEAQVPVARLKEHLTIEPSLPGSLQIGPVGMLAPGPDGRIAITQPLTNSVVVLSLDGTMLRRFAVGDVLSTVAQIGWHADSLWVSDGEGDIFLADMRSSATRLWKSAVPRPAFGVRHSPAMGVDPSGRIIYLAEFSGEVPTQRRVNVMRSDGLSAVTLTSVSEPRSTLRVSFGSGEAVTMGEQPFSTSTLMAVSPTGNEVVLVVRAAHSQSQAVILRRISVATNRAIVATVLVPEAPPIDEATKRRAIADYSRGLARRVGAERAAALVEAALIVPALPPAVSSLAVASEGSVWLRGYDDWNSPTTWFVINDDGVVVQSIEVPREARVLYPVGAAVWIVSYDVSGRPRLTLYDIER